MLTLGRFSPIAAAVLVFCLCGTSACKDKASAEEDSYGASLEGRADDTDALTESEAKAPSPGLTHTIDDPERIIFVNVDSATAFGGAIQPGDRFDIGTTLEHDDGAIIIPESDFAEGESRRSRLPVLNARILQDVAVRLVEPSGDGRWTLGLVVTPEQASLLRLAMRRGEINTLLRREGDVEKIDSGNPQTLRQAIDDAYGSDAARRRRRRHRRPVRPHIEADDADRFRASTLSARIQKGQYALALPAELPDAALAKINPGDRIDINGTFDVENDTGFAPKRSKEVDVGPFQVDMGLLENVRVLESRSDAGLIIEVTADQAALLALADFHGQLDVVLRGVDDHRRYGLSRQTVGRIFDQYIVKHTYIKARNRRTKASSSEKSDTIFPNLQDE